MKKMLNYYYKMYPLKIYNNKSEIYFFNDMNKYYIKKVENEEYVMGLIKLYNEVKLKCSDINEIIINKENNYVTSYEKKLYIVIKVNGIESMNIDINDIKKYNINIKNDIKKRNTSEIDTMIKEVDYYEELFSGYNKEYIGLQNELNYYIGIAENSIAYINDTINEFENIETSISHIKLNSDLSNKALIDITNLNVNYKCKDMAEYFRHKFDSNMNWQNELCEYFGKNTLSEANARIMFSIIIYPKRFFDYVNYTISNKMYDSVYNEKIKEYEKKIKALHETFIKYYNIPQIPWILNIK